MNESVFQPEFEEAIEVQPTGENVQIAVNSQVQPVQCTVNSGVQSSEITEYTVEDLVKLLDVGRRQIFNYARTVCEANSWETEITFKPRLGVYSDRMLQEMEALQEIGPANYKADRAALAQKLEEERIALAQRPQKVELTSALAVTQTVAISGLDGKIAALQQQQIQLSGSMSDRITLHLAQIQIQSEQAQERNQTLSNAMLVAAENEGVREGLEIFQRQQAARDATIAHLKAQELQARLDSNI
ncbi:MAG: hypothetical protein HC786_22040 [Richelia sp. CSU_2_1]|nr:hypothetical protein [Richelia sp. CSU_2_1]